MQIPEWYQEQHRLLDAGELTTLQKAELQHSLRNFLYQGAHTGEVGNAARKLLYAIGSDRIAAQEAERAEANRLVTGYEDTPDSEIEETINELDENGARSVYNMSKEDSDRYRFLRLERTRREGQAAEAAKRTDIFGNGDQGGDNE